MEVEHHLDDGVLIVTLVERRLDARSAPSFRDKLVDFINAGHHHIALDLSPVEFIDSSGLGAIISVLKQAVGQQGDLVIYGPRDTVLSLFKLTRLDKVFQILPQQAEAVAALRK